jgi:hypothetical protein
VKARAKESLKKEEMGIVGSSEWVDAIKRLLLVAPSEQPQDALGG